MITEMMPRLPTKKYKYIRQTHEIITAVAAEVMAEKQNDMRNGLEGSKDLMSLLLRANAKENKQQRMSDEEINAGIT
jgi:cytochrome P450